VKQTEKGYLGTRFDGSEYTVRDDPKVLDFFDRQWLSYSTEGMPLREWVRVVLGNVELWGKDLTAIEGLVDSVTGDLEEMEGESL
jgi:tagaturonate reductase